MIPREIGGATAVFALVGHPVEHSRSPALHNAWLRAAGIDAVYVALPAPRPIPDLGRWLFELGVRGANLTLPHKVAALPGCDDLDPVARACGAINVLIPGPDRIVGANTDGPGLLAALGELAHPIAGRRVALLGTGGAARAAVWAATASGARDVLVFGRNLRRAQEVAATAHAAEACPLTPAAFERRAPTLDVVINALPSAARAAVLALPALALNQRCAWIDLNYWDTDPPWLAALAARGHPTQRGEPMLLHQAALAFERFTGRAPDLAVGRTALAAPP